MTIKHTRIVISFFIVMAAFCSLARAEEIIVIGDSLGCGGFGLKLVPALARTANHVTMYCAVSSTAGNWVTGTNPKGEQCKTWTSENPTPRLCNGNGFVPPLSTILMKKPGAHIVVALGTNSIGAGRADAGYKSMAHVLKENGSKCDWVGPPHVRQDQTNEKVFKRNQIVADESGLDGFYISLNKVINAACTLIDSRPATLLGTPGGETTDGVHRNAIAGQYWVKQILTELEPESAAHSEAGGAIH